MSQRGKRGNNHRLECDPQPPPTKRRKGRPPNGSTTIGAAAGATTFKTATITTASNINENDHSKLGAVGTTGAISGGGDGGGGGGGGGGTGTGGGGGLGGTAAAGGSGGSSTDTGAGAVNCSGNNAALLHPSSIPMASAASTSHTISSKLPSTTGIGSSGGTSSSSVPWQARSVADIKISSIYNRSSTEAPAELYRKDLISAMKLPDSEPLASHEYLIVTDQWKQEWEKGVQVPVNPDSLPEPSVLTMQHPIVEPAHDFKLPKNRYVRITKDDTYTSELHYLTDVVAKAENTCAYDIDRVDEVWLTLLNRERVLSGADPIKSEQFECVIEELEIRCWEQIQVILKNEEGIGIEYDENVICDVCRSPDSEEANEMVFCDKCNICVHQACYGITAIPSGQWLCRTCSMDIKPGCVLCPNKGGAMKSTKSGTKWAHVSCALWIPEVSIGCVDRMEPITKISSIPQSRWALICVLCKERVGACIQCSVKTCKTAYHVTCAFQHGLEMRAIIEEGNAEDGVKLRSYCVKHSMMNKGKKANQKNGNNNGLCAVNDDDDSRRRKSRKDMTSEERNQVRARRLQEVEAEFDKHVNVRDISCHLFDCDEDAIISIYNYWKLKRKSRNNRALIPPKSEDVELIARKQEQADIENHKLFVHLRQDLERVRNLCYMVSRREKLKRSYFKLREQIFHKQVSVLSDDSLKSNKEHDEELTNAVIYANDGPVLYDRFYSSSNYQGDNSFLNLEYIKEKLLEEGKRSKLQTSLVASASTTTGATGALRTASRKKSISQYKKINVNGAKATRRNGGGEHNADSSGTQSSSSSSASSEGSSGSSESSSSSASSASSASSVSSASENELTKKKASSTKQHKKQSYSCSVEMRQKRRKAKAAASASAATLAASSSSDEDEKNPEPHKRRNNFLSQMEKELEKDKGALSSSNESEELIPLKNLDNSVKNIGRKTSAPIYSDSDSSTTTSGEDKDKTESNVSDCQTNIRTKAAMKEFTLQQSMQKQKKEAAAAKAKEDVSNQKDKEKAKEKTKTKDTTKDSSVKEKKDERGKKMKSQDNSPHKSAEKPKFVTDLVPQRQAAKKASENMRSANSYASSTATTTVSVAANKKDYREDRDFDRTQAVSSREKVKEKDRDKEKEKEKPKESSNASNNRSDEKVRPKEKDREKEKDKEREKPAEKVVGKRGRPPKNPQKDESTSVSSKHIISPRRDKVQAKSESAKPNTSKSITDVPNSIKPPTTDMTKNNILVTYVPQRQAAKKAAEQLKSGGIIKSSMPDVTCEERESREKESKLKSPESNKKHISAFAGEAHMLKTRRLSKEVVGKEVSSKEVSNKESTSRMMDMRKSRDSLQDTKDIRPVEVKESPSKSHSSSENTSIAMAATQIIESIKTEEDKEEIQQSAVQNVNITSTSESSSTSSSSSSSSSSDESDAEENRKSSMSRKLSKSSEKLTKNSTTITSSEPAITPTSALAKSPSSSNTISTSNSNNNGSLNESEGILKQEEHSSEHSKDLDVKINKIELEPAPIVLDDDDDDDDVSKLNICSPSDKLKMESPTQPQTIEIDDDEITKCSPVPNLEEEISQRKADLVSSSSSFNSANTNSSLINTNKSHRNFGSLDKLLNKKERELSSNNNKAADMSTFIEDVKSIDEVRIAKERIPTPSIVERASRLAPIEDPDIIELDSNSAQSLKIDSNEPQTQDDEAQDNSSDQPPQTPPHPSNSEESQKMLEQSPATPAAPSTHHHRSSSFDPITGNQINLLDNVQDAEENEDDDDEDATVALTDFRFSQVLDPPDLDCVAHGLKTGRESNKEDDSALTMNLVKKLRQTQSQKRIHNKCDDVPTDFGPPPTPAIPTTFPYNHHGEDIFQQKENSAPASQLKEDSHLSNEKVSTDPPVISQLTNNNNCSLIVPFSENAINFQDKPSAQASTVQFPSLQSTEQQQQTPQQLIQNTLTVNDTGSLFLNESSIVDDSKKKISPNANNNDCLNKLSDFKPPDFVDLHVNKEASMDFTTNVESVSGKLVDCDYDENTRMQSPYMNAPNMWNENDLIQTRRSVSTSPSSVSESNDLPHQLVPCSKANQQPQQQSGECNVVINQKNHFSGALESFGGALSSQFNSITQQNNSNQSIVNGIDMMSSTYGFSQQQQANHQQNQYNGPVSLFHVPEPLANIPNHINTISYPNPGAVLFPSVNMDSSVSLSTSRSQQQTQQQGPPLHFGNAHQSHQQESVTSRFLTTIQSTGSSGSGGAAFTSSSHNLALTAAIVSTSNATLDHHSPQNHQFNTTSAQFNSLLGLMPPATNVNNKESPSKRTSARFSQQQQQQQPPPRKSPQMHKSPGKSPRQMELLSKQMGPKGCSKFDGQTTGRQRKNSTRGTGTGRGRGRGRGRGGRLSSSSQVPSQIDYGNTHIVNNLVGTPYDFNYEDDMASSNVENLQSLRDRRRSFDCRGNLQQNTTPEQQKFTSPSYTCKMRSSIQSSSSNNCNSRQTDLKAATSNALVNSNNDVSILNNIVRPVLPGPVDMRTYSLDFEAQHSSASQEAYNNNLLGAFDSGTADQTLPDIDEEVEKEFQSALKASGTGIRHTQNSQPANVPEMVMPAELQTSMETTSEEISIDSDTTNTKVSLSDSRNQLKLKIKGPLAYPDNYNSTSLSVQQSSVQVSASQAAIAAGSSTVGGGGGGSTSGIRRMRKKELLQYWGQKETNLDDTVGLPQSAEKQTSSSDILISRCVGIPKAVDSMLSIPTKDDYKGYNSTESTSKRKKFGSRELRQLEMSYDVTEGNPERRRSGCSTGSNLSLSNETGGKTTGKRRGRSKTLESEEEQAPKLKIKIRKKSYESTSTAASGISVGTTGVGASTNMRIASCPPKKRLTSNYVIPSFEMLRRESMNYRKKVMADFGEDDEEKSTIGAEKNEVQSHVSRKKSSKQKKEHKKRKKQDKHIQVIENNASDAPPKLIIRFGKRKFDEEEAVDESIIKPPEASEPIIPIRLKLARNSEGGGYVIGNKQQLQQSENSEDSLREDEKLSSGNAPKGTDIVNTNQPVPPLKLRTNFHSEQCATDINACYSNSSKNSINDTPPTGLPPQVSDTSKTDVPCKVPSTDALSTKTLPPSSTANDCGLLPLNKDCEVR